MCTRLQVSTLDKSLNHMNRWKLFPLYLHLHFVCTVSVSVSVTSIYQPSGNLQAQVISSNTNFFNLKASLESHELSTKKPLIMCQSSKGNPLQEHKLECVSPIELTAILNRLKPSRNLFRLFLLVCSSTVPKSSDSPTSLDRNSITTIPTALFNNISITLFLVSFHTHWVRESDFV